MSPIVAWPWWAFEAAFALFVVVALWIVVLERRQPSATLAWILTIVLLPFIGLLLYWALGRRPIRRVRRAAARRTTHSGFAAGAGLKVLPEELGTNERGLITLALRTSAAPVLRSRTVKLELAGDAAWNEIRAAIADARESIHLEFYIWRDDAAGRRMVEALAERARAGVDVRLLYDPVGSLGLSRRHFAALIHAGGQVANSAPILAARLFGARANFRNHRKLLCIDGRLGYLGGINVGEEYLGPERGDAGWRDLLVRIEGEAAFGLDAIFQEDWLDATSETLPGLAEERARILPVADDDTEGALVQLIASGPDVGLTDAIAAQFHAAIASAVDRCWIATPYLIPDEALKLAITTTAMRGVDLRVLVPRHTDHRLVTLASRSYVDTLLEAGCRIFEFPRMFHSKYLIVDDGLSAVGSANMDIRSFHLNYEVTAMFYSRQVNADLAALYLDDLAHTRELSPRDRAAIGVARRGAEAFARLLSPLL